MKKYLSPGNLIVTAGGILAFVGMTAYFTDSVNLSVPTFFYGVPIFLIGLGLKTSEIPPVELFDKTNFAKNKFNRPKELTASKIHQISPIDVIKSDQKENNESFENKESTKNSGWDSSPLVPEVDEIPF